MEYSIYVIESKNTENKYVGSTGQRLEVRLSLHKSSHKENTYAWKVIDCGDFTIRCLAKVTGTRRDALNEEAKWIEFFGDLCVNKTKHRKPVEDVVCECGSVITKAGLRVHQERAIHYKRLADLEEMKKECEKLVISAVVIPEESRKETVEVVS